MSTIGDRIKEKRKKLGLTQAELGEKINVTDRAVSKWEQNEGNPDMSIVASLASVLGVTLDYLITGKNDDTISLEDMDDYKRALYLIKKDDVNNFKRYGYLKSYLLLNNQSYGTSLDSKSQKIVSAIYDNESVKIFTECLNESLSKLRGESSVLFVNCAREYLDKYIKLCCKTNMIAGLEFIGLKYFAIGEKTNISNPVRSHIKNDGNPASQGYFTYTLSKDTLNYIFSSEQVSTDIKNYMSEIIFFRDAGNKVYLMTDNVILELYKNGLINKLRENIKQMSDYNIFASNIYAESTRGSWYTGKCIEKNAIYFTNSGNKYLRALVYPIRLAMDLAKEKKDFEWIKVFNSYNKKLKELISDVDVYTLKDEEIKLLELESDEKTQLEDLISLKFLDGDFLDLNSLLVSEYGLKKEDKVARMKEKIAQIKGLKKYIKNHYLFGLELILDCLDKKDNKTLFKFSIDLGYLKLQNAVIDNNKELVKEIAFELFVPTDEMIEETESEKNCILNTHFSSHGKLDVEKVELERSLLINELVKKGQANFIEWKKGEFSGALNKEYYSKLLALQFETLPLGLIYKDITLDTIQEIKEQKVAEALEKLEDKIESITNERAMAKEYEKISSELCKEYLLSELNKGEADKVVVLICKRLQLILEYKYRYTGDLFAMIDTLIDKTMRLHNCYDDEDNNYRIYKEEDELFTKRIQLLHKLRMKRNNIVHPERQVVEMSAEEIKECINLIEKLS